MTRITNTTEFNLPLPNGIVIDAGKTRPVKEWPVIKINPGVKAYLKAGALVVEETEKPKRTRKAKAAPEASEGGEG